MFKFFTTRSNYQWINSLLIAVSAALLCKETFIVTGIDYEGYNVYAVAFLSTLYAYYPFKKNFSPQQFNALKNFNQLLRSPFFHSLNGFILLSVFFIHSIQSLLIIILAAGFSLLYFGMEIPGTGLNIRRLYFAKTILLALVWSIATVAMPVSFADKNLLSSSVIFVFARRFFFIAALTIPFEIRDSHKDASVGDKSFVNLIGVKKSKILAVFLLCIFLILALIQYRDEVIDLRLTAAMIISVILASILILIYQANKKYNNFILFCIDGMLMVQFFLVALSKDFH